ncbi:MAG: hypothetical protein M3303_14805 [Gemmatimonadota bacterium]|nr:hypothetical protein [Gemmatimonadota bacterium]
MSKKVRRTYRAPNGVVWGVEIDLPGSSNAMIIFRHPDGGSSSQDRYNWVISTGPEARSVTTRLEPARVMEGLDEQEIAALFRRSMRITAPDTLLEVLGPRS